METVAMPRPAVRTRSRASSKLKVAAVSVAALLVIAYFGISLYMAERVSHPTRKAFTSDPATLGFPYQDVEFQSVGDAVTLRGWFVDSPGDRTILVMHGRNGIRDDAGIGLFDITKALAAHNFDVLTFDFRAHGKSGGDRYSLGKWETRDVAGALAYLKGRGVMHIGTLAYSMGAATELLAAPDHPEMQAVVADSSFADLPEILERELPKASHLPAFFNPGVLFMANLGFGIDLPGTRPIDVVGKLRDRPLFIIHSTQDDLIPVSHAYRLRDAAQGDPNLQFWIAPGTGHVQAFKNNRDTYIARVTDFFAHNLK